MSDTWSLKTSFSSTNSSRLVTCVTCTLQRIESYYISGTACACVDFCMLRNRPEPSIVAGELAHSSTDCYTMAYCHRSLLESCGCLVVQDLLSTECVINSKTGNIVYRRHRSTQAPCLVILSINILHK
jgi:hypothetical protein